MNTVRHWWALRQVRIGVGALLGATGGYLYYAYIGCPAGGCPITSNPYLMVPLGAFAGYSMFADDKQKSAQPPEALD